MKKYRNFKGKGRTGSKGRFNKIKGLTDNAVAKPARPRRKGQKSEAALKAEQTAPWNSDTSYAQYDYFEAMRTTKARPGESTDELLKRFKRKSEHSGVLKEYRKREYYKSKGEKKREKKLKALKHRKREERKRMRYERNQ